MQIERIELATLSCDPANARKHGEQNIATIVASLKRFGQQKPIVIDMSDCVRAGNGTLEAARSLGWTHIDCVRTDLKGSDAIAYAIADNRTAELAEWDDDVLAATLNGLLADDPDLLNAAGFSEEELEELLGDIDGGEVVEDEIPEAPEDPVTKPGDLWILGEHRLLCGDSTKQQDVQRLMNGCKADAILTDPPYGVSYVGKTKDALTVESDDCSEEELERFVCSWFDRCLENCRAGAYWYATVPARPLHTVFALDWKRRGILRQIMVWVKDSMVLGHSEYHYRHEPILFGWVPGGVRHKNTDRTRTTVFEFARPKASREHPTMKPIELWSSLMKDASRANELFYEPFCGSGTTLIAAEQLNRKCYGMEISPAYCDVIVQRWENLTGGKAVLDDTRYEDDSASARATVADQTGVPRRVGKKTDKDNSRPAKQTA